MTSDKEIAELTEEIKASCKILTCLGDEMRQHIILVMIQGGDCYGMRVNDIASRSCLSRPAVSHHLKILREAGIVRMRREGTRNYYYIDADMNALNSLIGMLNHVRTIMASLPDRSGDGWN
ncbi:MAG: ArsR/SmtB family transcription factor [Bullifex sp.]